MPQAMPEVQNNNKDEYEQWNKDMMDREQERTENFTFEQKVRYVLTQPNYLLYNASITCLFITVTAIQFWMTDYMVQVLGLSQGKAFKTFASVSLIGPLGGIVTGGALFSRLGGYNSYKALHVVQIVGINAMVWGWFCAVSKSYPAFVVFIFFQLFCGGMTMPVANGLMLNQVP